MPVGSTIELYTLILGWFLYDGLWGIFVNSGIAIIPFVAVIINVLLETRDSQIEVSSAGLVRILETRIYTMLFVVFMAVQPMINVNPYNTVYTQTRCMVNTSGDVYKDVRFLFHGLSESSHDTSSHQYAVMLDGRTPEAPLWWYLVTRLSHAVTQAARQELPCSADLRVMSAGLQNLSVKNTVLRDEVRDFTNDCWQPALNLFGRNRPHEDDLPNRFKDGKILEDISWPGSDYFHSNPAYYETLRPKRANPAFPYSEVRDDVILSEALADGSGFPTCWEWWKGVSPTASASGGTNYGLRARLLEDLKSGPLADDCGDCTGAWWKFWSADKFNSIQRDDALIKTAMNNSKNDTALEMTNANRDFGGVAGGTVDTMVRNVKRRVGAIGMVMGSAKKATETEIVRQTAPIIQAIILLVFTVVLPLLMIIGGYSIQSLVALTMLEFSIIFWTFLFSLAAWVDNFLLTGLLSSAGSNMVSFMDTIAGPAGALDALTPMLVISWVSWALYTLVPLSFTYFLGVVGVRAGANIARAIEGDSASIGRQGGAGVGAIKTAITKGRG